MRAALGQRWVLGFLSSAMTCMGQHRVARRVRLGDRDQPPRSSALQQWDRRRGTRASHMRGRVAARQSGRRVVEGWRLGGSSPDVAQS
eukprot:3643043-Alexandrium_andersonii.AAC.1